jgi:hypothetical protein
MGQCPLPLSLFQSGLTPNTSQTLIRPCPLRPLRFVIREGVRKSFQFPKRG